MNSIAKVVNRFPALTASLGLVATLVAAIYGLQVFDHLSSGGYADPSSESWQTQQILEREFGGQRTDVVLLLESAGGSTMTTGDNAKTAQRM